MRKKKSSSKPLPKGNWATDEIDARTFQKPLAKLTVTIALKVEREGVRLLKPSFAAIDIYMMLRQALSTYNLYFYLNADERRENDPDWRVGYTAAILPLIRNMIDCLYNITAILDNSGPRGYQFRESGYKKAFMAIDEDEKRYGGNAKWGEYIARRRTFLDIAMRACGITREEVDAAVIWPTLGAYLRPKKKGALLTAHQQLLKTLTYGFWQEYSGMAHATFQGLMPTAMLYTPSDIPWEYREQFEDVIIDQVISSNLVRVAGILLCTITEVQAHFRFQGAEINSRLQKIWQSIMPAFEIRELYDLRYAKLMSDKGIVP